MIRWNEQKQAFEALDERGELIPPEQLPNPLRQALGGQRTAPPAGRAGTGELVSGAITGEVPLGERVTLARPFPTPARGTTSTIVHRPVTAPTALSAEDREVCRLMGVSEADFLVARARQPSLWASEPFYHPGAKP